MRRYAVLTSQQRKQYLSNPNSCPYCGSEELEAVRMEVDGTSAWQSVECKDCGKEWNDVFDLVDIEEIE